MRNDHFKFRQFDVRQDRCAMKVGTDGVLLGAWAMVPSGAERLLDIGTGTGLLALMMAQRFPDIAVTGVDIDAEAVSQATQNATLSPFSERITILHHDINQPLEIQPFQAIVCNPPYFTGSLKCPDSRRSMARHDTCLTFHSLARSAYRLLSDDGIFSLIIPFEELQHLESAAYMEGFFPSRRCHVKTTTEKPPKRCLIELRKRPVSERSQEQVVLQSEMGTRSPWYQQLTQDFYL